MRVAWETARLSYCQRRQVGAIVVSDDRIISIGYNGTPRGWQNVCEDCNGQTHSYVLHAEFNALGKLAGSNDSAYGADLFCTTAPCIHCAKLIQVSHIKRVFYNEKYSGSEGLDYLEDCEIPVIQTK